MVPKRQFPGLQYKASPGLFHRQSVVRLTAGAIDGAAHFSVGIAIATVTDQLPVDDGVGRELGAKTRVIAVVLDGTAEVVRLMMPMITIKRS
jgi:hypothetical protein